MDNFYKNHTSDHIYKQIWLYDNYIDVSTRLFRDIYDLSYLQINLIFKIKIFFMIILDIYKNYISDYIYNYIRAST